MNRRDFLTFRLRGATSAAHTVPLNPAANSQTRNSNLNERQLASRFLNQATLGHTVDQINAVTALGFEGWINNQFAQPLTNTTELMKEIVRVHYTIEGEGEHLYFQHFFRFAWWQALMTNPDQLRQKVAYALSQIMVISSRLDALADVGSAVSTFHDVLLKHAFGNFRDLLYDVSLSPAMGAYLSHAGNQKSDPSINRYPDENYARKVMLREPFTRYTQLCKSLEARNIQGENLFFNYGATAQAELGQYPYFSPSVFNFYMPDYRPLGPLLDADLNGPEFQITTSVGAIRVFNFMENAILDNRLMDLPDTDVEEEEEFKIIPPDFSAVELNLDPYLAMEGNVDGVVDRLDLLLTYGSLSDSMRSIIRQSISDLYSETGDWDGAVRFGLLLWMTNPEYAVLK